MLLQCLIGRTNLFEENLGNLANTLAYLLWWAKKRVIPTLSRVYCSQQWCCRCWKNQWMAHLMRLQEHSSHTLHVYMTFYGVIISDYFMNYIVPIQPSKAKTGSMCVYIYMYVYHVPTKDVFHGHVWFAEGKVFVSIWRLSLHVLGWLNMVNSYCKPW